MHFLVRCGKYFLIFSILHIYSLKIDYIVKRAISFKVRATRLWNKTLNFFFEILIERYDWLVYTSAKLTLFQISSNISGSCHLNQFIEIFLWLYLPLLHEKCSYNQEKKWKWKRHIWRTLQYQKKQTCKYLNVSF